MVKQLGRTLGVRTRYTGTPEYDVNKQLASFEQELARKPAGILLHPMNPDPMTIAVPHDTQPASALVPHG